MENIYKYAFTLKNAKKIAKEYYDKGYKIVGIEAEWGNSDLKDVFPEAAESLSHHGRFSSQPPPCNRWDLYGKYETDTCFIFSHFDLDALFGCMILEGAIEDNQDARNLTDHIGWVDVMGQHRAHEDTENYNKWTPYMIELNKTLNLLKKQKMRSEKLVPRFKEIFKEVIAKNPETYYEAMKRFEIDAYNSLDKVFSVPNKLHVYISYSTFLSKYCIQHEDFISISEINIQYDSKNKRLSIAARDEELAKKYFGENGVISILQEYFGKEAGGRVTVGGSPKNKKILYNDVIKIIKDVKTRISDGGQAVS